jgi:peptidoglycan/LPS O-acetylase OafA/YrhL
MTVGSTLYSGSSMTEKRPAGKTSSVKREIELDFVRGIAILLVLTFHYQRYDPLPLPGPVRVVMSFGWIGVDLFWSAAW